MLPGKGSLVVKKQMASVFHIFFISGMFLIVKHNKMTEYRVEIF
jgi:hypothetical protein